MQNGPASLSASEVANDDVRGPHGPAVSTLMWNKIHLRPQLGAKRRRMEALAHWQVGNLPRATDDVAELACQQHLAGTGSVGMGPPRRACNVGPLASSVAVCELVDIGTGHASWRRGRSGPSNVKQPRPCPVHPVGTFFTNLKG